MGNNYLRRNIGLLLFAAAGVATFIFLLDKFYPYKATNIRIGRSQAIEVATDFMDDRGYNVDDYHVMTMMEYDAEAFVFLQKKYGFHAAQDMVRYKSNHGFDFAWVVFWFKNLPQNAPQERFRVYVSGRGNIVGFRHEFPPTSDWPRPDRAHLEQEEALDIAVQFLKEHEINLAEFQEEIFRTQEQEKRTHHTFRWRNLSDYDDSFVELLISVQGDEVGNFQIQFQIPEESATSIKRQSGNEYFMDRVISVTVLFLIGLLAMSIFLKKYHEGEVEVRTASIVFLVLLGAFVLQAILRFRFNASTQFFGELSRDGVALFIFILLVLIIRPIVSIFGFAAWSVGESFGREQFGGKFKAIDGLLNQRFFTIDFARSALQGYCAGFISLGLIAVLFWISLKGFGCTTTIGGYQGILTVPLPFLIPVLVAISGSLLAEMVFRLFGNLFVYRHLRVKSFSVIVSAAIWSFYVPGFWGIQASLYPLDFEILVWFFLGLFFGFIFWKYDLLTVIFANFVAMGVMQSLPMITSPADSVFTSGVISLVFLSLPLILIVIGFIKRDEFTFKMNLVPGHIQRIEERVRMSKELEIARQVQMRLLPKKSPHVPGFEISGVCIPAKETGGDYFDFIELGKSKLGIVIGDVSGKGVPAAIYMTLTKGIVQSHADDFVSPMEVLVKVNDLLYKTIDRDSFVSLFYAVLEIEKKTIMYSRAGHNPVLYFRDRERKCDLLEPDGIALGLEKGDIFRKVIKEKEMKIEKGELLVFYTDGFTEALNKGGEEYGEDRLMNSIQRSLDKSVRDIHDAVLKDIKAFMKDTPQQDDMTMIFIKGC